MTLQARISGLRRLAALLPRDMKANWKDTNHYEISGTVDGVFDQWWVRFSDLSSDTDYGRRVGAVLDSACALPCTLSIITELEQRLAVAREALNELVELKDWKDGNTTPPHEYYVRKPKAWQRAREALAATDFQRPFDGEKA